MTTSMASHRLARDGRGAYLDDSGACFGIGVPLLEHDDYGRWRARPRQVLERLFAIGLGAPIDLSWRMIKLAGVARALNAGDRSLAAITLVQAELPTLTSDVLTRRMALADGVSKAYDATEPRDACGRWTTGDQTQMADADTISLAAKRPASSLSLSEAGLWFIGVQEAARGPNLSVYLDQGGNPTIGYGHLLKPGESFPDGITADQASQMLAQDVAAAERIVRRRVTADLTQAQFDALVSFTYNEGERHLARSTLLARLNAGDYDGAAGHFADWDEVRVNDVLVYSPGLAARRERERNLFVNGSYK